jgi:hypothetical protein
MNVVMGNRKHPVCFSSKNFWRTVRLWKVTATIKTAIAILGTNKQDTIRRQHHMPMRSETVYADNEQHQQLVSHRKCHFPHTGKGDHNKKGASKAQ